MISLKEIKESLLHLAFPHVCSGCGGDLLDIESSLCLRCMEALPETGFHRHSHNPVEKIFWGRIQVSAATSQFYFTKESMMQRLMHQFKYKGNKDLGIQLGRIMGKALLCSGRFDSIEALVPLPLYPAREKRRGYNQAAVLCEGIESVTRIPVLKNVISRPQYTGTQTRMGRIDRWHNMEGKFRLDDEKCIRDKHILLVDDVITTGATLEACAGELSAAGNCTLSIATLCFTTH